MLHSCCLAPGVTSLTSELAQIGTCRARCLAARPGIVLSYWMCLHHRHDYIVAAVPPCETSDLPARPASCRPELNLWLSSFCNQCCWSWAARRSAQRGSHSGVFSRVIGGASLKGLSRSCCRCRIGRGNPMYRITAFHPCLRTRPLSRTCYFRERNTRRDLPDMAGAMYEWHLVSDLIPCNVYKATDLRRCESSCAIHSHVTSGTPCSLNV